MQLKSKQTQCVHCYYNGTFLFYLLHITSGQVGVNDAFNGEMTDNSTPLDGVRITPLKTVYCGECHRPI